MAYRPVSSVFKDCDCYWNPCQICTRPCEYGAYANWTCCCCGTVNFDHEEDGNDRTFCYRCGHARDLVEGEPEPLARYINGPAHGTHSTGPR